MKSFNCVSTNPSGWSRDFSCGCIINTQFKSHAQVWVYNHTAYCWVTCLTQKAWLYRALQARALDYTKVGLSDARSGTDTLFHPIFKRTSRHAREYDIPVETPRGCSLHTACENHPGSTTEEYYHRSIAIPFLNHLKSEIYDRWQQLMCLGYHSSKLYLPLQGCEPDMVLVLSIKNILRSAVTLKSSKTLSYC